jgi:23S rRNA (uracil1939-C5)-methyltransferase
MAPFLFDRTPAMREYHPCREAVIESLDHEGRGVSHVDGKTIFIEGALPGERVEFASYKVKPNYEVADVKRVLGRVPSVSSRAARISACAAAAACSTWNPQPRWRPSSGCWRTPCGTSARARPEMLYPPIVGPAWGYRYRARLTGAPGAEQGRRADRLSRAAQQLRRGHGRRAPILPPHVSALVPGLRAADRELSAPTACRRSRWRWARGHGAGVAPSRCRSRGRRGAGCAPLPRREAGRSRSGCSPSGPDSAAPVSGRCAGAGLHACPNSMCRWPSGPPTSPRSTWASTAC